MTRLTDKSGPFGFSNLDTVVENPDGVIKTYDDGRTRSSLYDADFVSNSGSQAFGYVAFPGESDGGMCAPSGWGDSESTGTVTGASSKNRLGKQR